VTSNNSAAAVLLFQPCPLQHWSVIHASHPMQDRTMRRVLTLGDVGVPLINSGRTSLVIIKANDFRIHIIIVCEWVYLDIAKSPSKLNMLFDRNCLITKKYAFPIYKQV
jgi:hypothetical protein